MLAECLEERLLLSNEACVIRRDLPESPSLKESSFARGHKCHRVEIEQIVFTSRKWIGFHFIALFEFLYGLKIHEIKNKHDFLKEKEMPAWQGFRLIR